VIDKRYKHEWKMERERKKLVKEKNEGKEIDIISKRIRLISDGKLPKDPQKLPLYERKLYKSKKVTDQAI
jgi:hypothetical protein